MAEENETPNPDAAAAANAETTPAQAPAFGIAGQYVRDLSFENPNAPASLLPAGTNPASNININVQVKKQADDLYAVELGLNVKTEREGTLLYALELVYGGLFRTKNIAENQLGPLLMVEGPRLIFPFARQIIAQTIQGGGFPPLMIEPVDFLALYRRNLQAAADKIKQDKEAGATPVAANQSDPNATVN